jgi:murein L,D-transpeptidase YafK
MLTRRGFATGAAGVVLPLPGRKALAAVKADRVVVAKSNRQLYMLRDGEVLCSFRVALGWQPVGTKIYQGDGRTPEGSYRISAFNERSRFYRSLRISYPNEHDLAVARVLGQSVGGDIMVHGLAPERSAYGADHWRFNWTNGCIAVTNKEIDEIWQRLEIGTPIDIRP